MDYGYIHSRLGSQRDLAAAFPAIREKARMTGNWAIEEEAENLWATYRQMMLFATRGVNDPQAAAMRDGIADRLQRLALQIERQERLDTHREQRYVSKHRELKSMPSVDNIAEMLSTPQSAASHEQALVKLFTWLWTCGQWSAGDTHVVGDLLFSDRVAGSDKAVIVSAVTLSLLEFPDRAKLLMLLDCYLSDDVQLSQRALVGFVLATCCAEHANYLDFSELHERLEAFRGDPEFVGDMFMVMSQLQASCVTDKVTSKMRQDIMPALLNRLKRKAREEESLGDGMEQMNKHGENPEWTEWMQEEGIDKKMREMAEMQLAGDDIQYNSFQHMKGNAFFNEMAHWFYPFSLDSPSVPEVKALIDSKLGNLARLLLGSAQFCDSDKYSICFTFSSVGSYGAKFVEEHLHSQLPSDESIDEVIAEAEKRTPTKRDVCRSYIFDLYRFFHSYPYHPQFKNPFAQLKAQPIVPEYISAFSGMAEQCPDATAQYADFLMRKEFYATAAGVFTHLINNNEYDPALAAMWQKLGFCHQHLEQWNEAQHAYEVANDLKPNSMWTLKHLVAVCEKTAADDRAIHHCRSILAIEPDNVKYIVKWANMLVFSKHDYVAALPLLHKANYLDENSDAVKKLLALCLLMTGDIDKAMRHIGDLMAAETPDGDAKALNATALLIAGNTVNAFAAMAAMGDDLRGSFMHDCLQAVCRQQLLDQSAVQLLLDAAQLLDNN